MKSEAILDILEDTLRRMSVKLTYEDLRKGEVNTNGGMFLLRGEKRIIVHKGLCVDDKIDVLVDILTGMDTESIHLPPAVRKLLDGARQPS